MITGDKLETAKNIGDVNTYLSTGPSHMLVFTQFPSNICPNPNDTGLACNLIDSDMEPGTNSFV